MTSITDAPERAWAEVDLTALAGNARTVARVSGTRLLPMIKADAYGIGAPAAVRALAPLSPWGFGVATLEEAAALRATGVDHPLVAFSPLHPRQIPSAVAHGVRPVIGDTAALRDWIGASGGPFHAEIDTGMGRTGFRWDETGGWRELLSDAGACEGIFTHFHSAETDPGSVTVQWERLQAIVSTLRHRPALVHAANSAAALGGPAFAGDLVRPGIFLYGGNAGHRQAAPVVRLQARVVAIRTIRTGDSVSYDAIWVAKADTVVATLGIGYADGLHRSLSNCGVVELNGAVVPIVGRVTMDFTMVVPAGPCQIGDVATIFGGRVSLDDQATRAGTISYELLTAMGPRIQRRYHG
ncbi:MAG: alanine racemase [Gemmatimonadota bacterium]|nr:alanine racemase [Gemmatimonadota bacterium]